MIYEGVTCALCEQAIDNAFLDAGEFVATTHFLDDGTNPLCEFSDAAIHKTCFLAWPLREDFIQAHNEAMKEVKDRRGLHWHMEEDGELVSHNDQGEIVFVDEEEDERFLEDFLRSIGNPPLA